MHLDVPDSPYTLALQPGTLLGDRFRIGGPVGGASAFAITYRAEDLTTGESVIVKEFFPRALASRTEQGAVRPHSSEDERDFMKALRRFAIEGAVLAEASHPNLVRVRRVVEANGTTYLVMNDHRTQSLIEHLAAAGGRLAPAQAGRLIQQLLSALEPLHAESIVHRDLSPRTVHVSDGNALLLGFSARRHMATHATDLAPGFAAFEQYGTRDVGPWTDVYAAAAVLYYLLTGITPPTALERAAGEALVPPNSAVPGLSSGLARLVMRGMALLPQQRPHSASELRRQLETALTDSANHTRPAASSSGFDGAALAEVGGPETADRGPTLRLAEGGIVVPGEDSAGGLLRKLGSAFRRPPASFDALVDEPAQERVMPAPAAREVARPIVPAPAPVERVTTMAELRPDERPVVSKEAIVVIESMSNIADPTTPFADRQQPRDIAAQIAFATEELQHEFGEPTQHRRYSLVAATVLVLLVGGSLVLLTRSGGATGAPGRDARVQNTVPSYTGAAAPRTDSSHVHEAVSSGAVQQGGTPAAAIQTQPRSSERAVTQRQASIPSREKAAPPPASAPVAKPPALPSVALGNLNVAVNAAPDLKIVPPEMLVDARTRLTNGEDLIEQGDYQVARKTFRTAMAQVDSVGARYPDSQSIRALRHEIEQADAKAGQACIAENDMRRRRGETARACQ